MFPQVLNYGYVDSARISGVKGDGPGRRYVGLTLSGDLEKQILKEREALLALAEGAKVFSRVVPHFNVFEAMTKDDAAELHKLLGSVASHHLLIEIGEAKVVPLRPHPSRSPAL